MRCYCCDHLSTKENPVERLVLKRGQIDQICMECFEAIWPPEAPLEALQIQDALFPVDDDFIPDITPLFEKASTEAQDGQEELLATTPAPIP